MKYLFLLITAFTLCNANAQTSPVQLQDFIDSGDFGKADSVLTEVLKGNPYQKAAARYDKAQIRLLLKDTVYYCKEVWDLRVNGYASITPEKFLTCCGRVDTMYFTKSYQPANKHHYRYYEVVTQSKFENYPYIEVHDKLGYFNQTVIFDDSVSRKWNLIAKYMMLEGKKFYLATQSPPSFQGGISYRNRYISDSPFFKEAMRDLSLHHVIVKVRYRVDRDGLLSNIEVFKPDKKTMDDEKLKALSLAIIKNMPVLNPGKFMGNKVDFYVKDQLTFGRR